MANALPKTKYPPLLSPKGVSVSEGMPRNLKIALSLTLCSLILLWFLVATFGKIAETTFYNKEKIVKECKVLQQTTYYIKSQLEQLISPLSIEEIAKNKGMVMPQKVYHLRLGN